LGNFREHSFASFASMRIGKGQASVQHFLDAIKRHRWNEGLQYQGGQDDPDNAEAIALKCPDGGFR